MTQELKALIFSMSYNFIISIIKLFGGGFFHLGSLFADGLHTLGDFITDLISFLGVHLFKKKPTKYHPFGFGRGSYLTNLFIGMLLVILAIYIIASGFLDKVVVPDDTVFLLLITVFILKFIVLVFLYYVGNHIRSQVLITSYQEARADLFSTIVVFLVAVLLKFSDTYSFLEYADVIGSSFIGLMMLRMSIQIITENSLSLLGKAEVDSDLVTNIREFILGFNEIKNTEFALIKYGVYYQIYVMLEVNGELSLHRIINLEQRLRESLVRHRSFHVKYSTIYVTNYLDK